MADCSLAIMMADRDVLEPRCLAGWPGGNTQTPSSGTGKWVGVHQRYPISATGWWWYRWLWGATGVSLEQRPPGEAHCWRRSCIQPVEITHPRLQGGPGRDTTRLVPLEQGYRSWKACTRGLARPNESHLALEQHHQGRRRCSVCAGQGWCLISLPAGSSLRSLGLARE